VIPALDQVLRKGDYARLAWLLDMAKSGRELMYVDSRTLSETLICPLAARLRAEEREVEVFLRWLRDRTRYAIQLGLADAEAVKGLATRAVKGDKDAARQLLRIGEGLGPSDVERLRPIYEAEWRRRVKILRLRLRRRPSELSDEEWDAAATLLRARPYPFMGMAREVGGYVVYAVAGVGEDHIYLIRVARPSNRQLVKRLASAEGDVAAAVWGRPRKVVDVVWRGGRSSLEEEARDVTPRVKQLTYAECRTGKHCRACPYRRECPCVNKP